MRTTAFPSAEEEVWRYSPLREVNLEDFSLAGDQAEQGAAADAPGAETADAPGADEASRGRADDELQAQLLGSFGEAAALVAFRDGALIDCRISAEAAEAGLSVAPLSRKASAAKLPQTPGAGASLSSSEDPGLGDIQAEASGEPPDYFVLLNDAFAAEPVHVFVPRGVRLERPILVVHILGAAGGVAVFPRLLLTLEEGADAQVVDAAYSLSSQFSALFVPVVEISVAASARLGYLSVQKLNRRTTAVANTSAVVGNQAHLNVGIVAVGGGYARSRVDSCLTGRGATGDMSAMYFADGCQVHDFRVLQNHNAPDTTSNLLFVGAVDDEARSIYSGLIRVANGARGTDAIQTNRILKLSEGVWAESVPNLEIENDDVKCAHSTSVGPIDEAQRFYLESRGVPPDLAERLIVEGYFGEVAARLPVPALSEAMSSLVSTKLRPHV